METLIKPLLWKKKKISSFLSHNLTFQDEMSISIGISTSINADAVAVKENSSIELLQELTEEEAVKCEEMCKT